MAAVPKPPSSYESSIKRQEEFQEAFKKRTGGLSLFDRVNSLPAEQGVDCKPVYHKHM